MKHSNFIRTSLSIIFAIILLYSLCISSSSIYAERKQLYTKGAESSEIAYSSALLGGFKGLIADILWIRLTDLQMNHKFLEMLELTEIITQLEPHLSEVWTFHAWNLAYNISIYADNEEDKWTWVKNGFELLRDKGLEINPGDPVIALDLAFIFQHKISSPDADKYNNYYRTQWVKDITPYLEKDGGIPKPNSIMAAELEQNFKLDPTIMHQIEEKFGKIDWRSPYAYSLYWGWIAKKTNNKDTNLRSTRMIYTSADKLSFETGKIEGDPLEENWTFSASPNYMILEQVCNYVYDSMYEFDAPGIKHIFAKETWAYCIILIQQNKVDEAQAVYERFCKSFSGYNFPPMEIFINDFNELQAFSYAIDEKLVTLNPRQ